MCCSVAEAEHPTKGARKGGEEEGGRQVQSDDNWSVQDHSKERSKSRLGADPAWRGRSHGQKGGRRVEMTQNGFRARGNASKPGKHI